MKAFLNEDFLLQNKTAQRLYHDYAKEMPIIDYHNHLIPEQVANNHSFENITKLWLDGDHYKWRAMRANGVNEKYITGNASDRDKFRKWAETVPYTMRNPLYHWTHLELQRYFGISTLLSSSTADSIYDEIQDKLTLSDFSVHGLLKKMKVEILCTTDDPIDSLQYHQQFAKQKESFRMFPAFRPDKAMQTDDIEGLNNYIDHLSEVTKTEISNYSNYLLALRSRHDYFADNGCKVSDHGLEHIYAEDYTQEEIEVIFEKLRTKSTVSHQEKLKFKSAMLREFADWDYEKGWVQQFHLGPLRNNNSRMLRILGPDTGWDSIGDFSQAKSLSKFLNTLDNDDRLTKTILYNLNPADNDLFATMVGNFNDGTIKNKVQFGAAWWFSDQKEGMTKQINTLSNMGLLSLTVGMLTDSRSFLSFPRHEYFRRILCNILGNDIEEGELPMDIDFIGQMVKNICYYNAKNYFNF